MALKRPKRVKAEPFPERPRGLTAAVAQVDLSAGSSWKTWKFGNADWQAEAWRLYDIVPELNKLAGRVGDSVAKARLYVTMVDETGEETGEVAEKRIQRLAAIPLGTGAARDECLSLAGTDLAVGGECWIVGEDAARRPDEAEGSWFVVTGSALKRTGEEITVERPQQRGAGTLKLTEGRDFLIRCWNPHPNEINRATSFARAATVPLREIELLTKREFAELDSRLTGAGIMFVPEGVDYPREEGDPVGIAGFMAYIMRAAAASMVDQSDARAMVPIVASLPDQAMQYVDQMKPVNFWSELSAQIGEMKDKAILRVANSAEIPPEVITGMSDANHWSAWLISDEGVRWIGKYLGLIANALTRGFLRNALEKMGIANPERYAFAFDTSTLAAKPNRLEEAERLHDRGLLSDEELVKAAAFSIDQMPNEAERAKQIVYKLVMAQPDMALDPEVQRLLGLPAIRSVGLPATADQNADNELPGQQDAPAIEGPPRAGRAPQAPDETAAIEAALARRLTASRTSALPAPDSAEFMATSKQIIMRALELAGGRLASPAERRPSGQWGHVPRHELHAYVGPISRDKAAQVTEGAWTHVPMAAADLGVDPGQLQALLSGYVIELLMRGRAHEDDLLFAALSIANRGKGLVAA
jgi:hypothetical protein